jgi:hypothetical protein
MTPWLGFAGFGEAPTSAIVFASLRISSGLLTLRSAPASTQAARSRERPRA